jgi:hypothetical protein
MLLVLPWVIYRYNDKIVYHYRPLTKGHRIASQIRVEGREIGCEIFSWNESSWEAKPEFLIISSTFSLEDTKTLADEKLRALGYKLLPDGADLFL